MYVVLVAIPLLIFKFSMYSMSMNIVSSCSLLHYNKCFFNGVTSFIEIPDRKIVNSLYRFQYQEK